MGYDKLVGFTDLMWRHRQSNLDFVCCVSGRKGMGKSSFAIQAARFYLKKYFNREFSVKEFIAYDNSEVQAKIKSLPEGSPLVCDEAARFAMGEDWNKSENKDMKKLFAQMRTKHLIVFLCLPRFGWLDRKYREDMVSYWAWIPTRGSALLFSPDDNPGVPDVWHLKDFNVGGKVNLGRISMLTDPDVIISKTRKHRCFNDVCDFPVVPKELYEKYVAIRDEKAFGEENPVLDQRSLAKFLCYNLKVRWPEFVRLVEGGRLGRPTLKMLSEEFLKNPVSGKSLAAYVTVQNWVKAVDRVLELERRGGVVS